VVQRLTSDYVPPILAVLDWYQSIGGGMHEKQPIMLFLITQELPSMTTFAVASR
jgi:hypothetical protein